jgi:hypothetical protein
MQHVSPKHFFLYAKPQGFKSQRRSSFCRQGFVLFLDPTVNTEYASSTWNDKHTYLPAICAPTQLYSPHITTVFSGSVSNPLTQIARIHRTIPTQPRTNPTSSLKRDRTPTHPEIIYPWIWIVFFHTEIGYPLLENMLTKYDECAAIY